MTGLERHGGAWPRRAQVVVFRWFEQCWVDHRPTEMNPSGGVQSVWPNWFDHRFAGEPCQPVR